MPLISLVYLTAPLTKNFQKLQKALETLVPIFIMSVEKTSSIFLTHKSIKASYFAALLCQLFSPFASNLTK